MALKILIADDEQEILELTAKKIAESGYDVVTAADGLDAWEKIQSESPDIILLDLNMPEMNGFGVLKALRDHPPQDKWQPVIIVSARGELEDVQQGLSLEAEHYLVKPCSAESILKAIQIVKGLIPQHKLPSEFTDNHMKLTE